MKDRHTIICKIVSDLLHGWTREELVQYVFDKEYDRLNLLPEHELQATYTNTLEKQQRKQDEV